MNSRTALGAGFVLVAVLAGALFLDRAQRLVPVYAAARDLPAGTPLKSGDLTVVRVRLPDSALRHYLQPGPDRAVAGRVLTAPIRRQTLVPAELALTSQQADLVELPVQADPGDMAQGLRPGDRVQVLAAYTDGARRGRAVVLLPTAEVVRVLGGPRRAHRHRPGARRPAAHASDRAPAVAAGGRAAGMVTVATTQKPSADVVPTFLRDLFGFRWALRCSTPQVSDTILGSGLASEGYSAAQIDPTARGVGLLLQEGGVPVRLRACYLDDLDLAELARRAEQLRGTTRPEAPTLRLLDGTA